MNVQKSLVIVVCFMFSLSFFSAEQLSGEEDNIEFSIFLHEGWNLVGSAMFAYAMINPESDIQQKDIRAVYIYDHLDNEYVLVYPLPEDYSEIEKNIQDYSQRSGEYFGDLAGWVYSDRSGELVFTTDDVKKPSDRQLHAGWNFLTIDKSFLGHTIPDVSGTCEITRLADWKEGENSWVVFDADSEIPLDSRDFPVNNGPEIGKGYLIYVTGACKLNVSPSNLIDEIPTIPNLDLDDDEDVYYSHCTSLDSCILYEGDSLTFYGEQVLFKSVKKINSEFFVVLNIEGDLHTLREFEVAKTENMRLVVSKINYSSIGNSFIEFHVADWDETNLINASGFVCNDSDGGTNPYTFGSVYSEIKSTGFSMTNEDVCILGSSYNSDNTPGSWMEITNCSDKNCYIAEAFCRMDSTGNLVVDGDATQLIQCSKGCKNGVCAI